MIGYSNGEAIAVCFNDRAAIFLDKKQGETFRRTTLNSPHFIPQPRLASTDAPMIPTRRLFRRATIQPKRRDKSYTSCP